MPIRARAVSAAALTGLVTSAIALGGCATENKPKRSEIADPVVVTYAGGIYVLDGKTLNVAADVKLDGFNRVNPSGDDSHMLVSTKSGFRVLDAVHGEFTDIEFPGAKPGHVVRHAGRTVLFADGTGEVTSFDPRDLKHGKPDTTVYKTAAPHHGVAIELADGRLVTTLGTEEKRTGIVVLDKDRKEIARNEDCPGVHGESTAAGEAIVIGCQNGALIYRDGVITKVTSPTPYGRIGNQAGTDVSPIAFGDYKQDKDAELERPQQISLIDTRDASLRLVPLGTSYSFRSLARGPQGEALLLGTDGRMRVIDPTTAAVTRSFEVVRPWEEPLDWQQPRPAVFARGIDVYVSEPATRQLHRVDLAAGTITASVTLDAAPNELSGIVAQAH
ncbi:zinc metallochaperone AztD [Nocardia sp. CDC160]|uniref:zinc metallochaperone AztD n=1 Tax=Nocardia sp. CDC160 TaxID=3112166 RepID=UPI002DB92C56|nr:zinc metallochaperone AztD [Nocardia sp. CDC160]MEC3918814.1 zinc metallochaperone AztD [Nocardia sp. CDC160]